MPKDDPSPRWRQKQRTREALLDGARALLAEGRPVTVAGAAEAAGISKATAYRYFGDAHVLGASAGLPFGTPSYAEIVKDAETPREKVLAVVSYLVEIALENEALFRNYLARALDAWANSNRKPGQRRGATRVALIEAAVDELALDEKAARLLENALIAICVYEAVIAMRDAGGASDSEIRETVTVLAEALLDRYC
ncbi:MAG: TetR/AcrR family transcriptional regulator [Paracoccaceae bacterium]|nr:TetR/AcrR family transcriptional regulator [Paracoccaceae bacterium]